MGKVSFRPVSSMLPSTSFSRSILRLVNGFSSPDSFLLRRNELDCCTTGLACFWVMMASSSLFPFVPTFASPIFSWDSSITLLRSFLCRRRWRYSLGRIECLVTNLLSISLSVLTYRSTFSAEFKGLLRWSASLLRNLLRM